MATIVHFELPAADVERARGFWSGVFGWTFAGMDGPFEYLMTQNEEPVGAIFKSDEPTSGRSARERSAGDLGHIGHGSETLTDEVKAIEPTEASLPLVTALMITGGMFIARSTSAGRRSNRSGRS